MAQTKIIVLDDDPTGSQTVHSCLLLTQWDVDTLRTALLDDSPLFFVLTNTRGMSAHEAAEITRKVCVNLRATLASLKTSGTEIQPILVSRSDSTLRGHYPVETDVIAEELGPFDAHFITPAFFEGGRTTRNGIHYLRVGDRDVPVHETEFARDSVFGYKNSFLPAYVEEKTQGRIPANQVHHFNLTDVRGDLSARLMSLKDNACCVVDAETQSDLNNFAHYVKAAAQNGKRFLFRSAASLLTSLAMLPPQPIAAMQMSAYVRQQRAGAVIVGSHVAKTTQQLNALLAQTGTVGVEVNVDLIAQAREQTLQQVMQKVEAAFSNNSTAVVFTSRSERQFPDQASRLAFGQRVSAFLMDVIRALPKDIGFLISKGGITSNDTLSTGLALRTARILGQLLPGVSVVACPKNHPRFPDLPVVIFPGNVGDESALATAVARLSGPRI